MFVRIIDGGVNGNTQIKIYWVNLATEFEPSTLVVINDLRLMITTLVSFLTAVSMSWVMVERLEWILKMWVSQMDLELFTEHLPSC